MPTGVHIKISEDGADRVKGQLNSISRATEAVARASAKAHSANLALGRRSIDSLTGKMSTGINRAMTGIGIAGGLGFAAISNSVMEFDANLTQLAVSANLDQTALDGLRKHVLSTATATNQLSGDLVGGMAQIVQATGDIGLAQKAIGGIGRASTASGASVESLAAMTATLGQQMGIAGEDIDRMFGILHSQGKLGAFELRNMAQEFPTLLGLLGTFNVKGVEGVQKFGGMLQIVKQLFGGESGGSEAATAMQGLMTAFTRRSVVQRLKGQGIAAGVGVSPVETAKQIVEKTGGDQAKMVAMLKGGDAKTAILTLTAMAQSFKRSGGTWGELNTITSAQGAEGLIAKDFAIQTSTASAQVKKMRIELENTAIAKLMDSFRSLAAQIAGPTISAIQYASENFYTVAAALVGIKMLPSALNALIKSSEGATGAMGRMAAKAEGIWGKIGAGVIGFEIGYAVGTWLDKKFNLSGSVADTMFELLHPEQAKKLAEGRGRAFTEETYRAEGLTLAGQKKESAIEAARLYAENANRMGAGRDTDRGKTIRSRASGKLQSMLAEAGITGAEGDKQYQALMRIVAAVEKKDKITITPAQGMDKPQVVQSRGGK